MIKRLLLGLLAAALTATITHAQSNGRSAGGQTVPGVAQFCFTGATQADGSLTVVPCQTAAGSGGFPAGATPITASATGTTAATTATLAAAAGKFTYICGFSINSTATAAAAGNATVTGTTGGTLNYEMGTGVSPAVVITTQSYTPCIPSSAVNTGIAVVSAAPGAGGVISVTAWGFQQ